MITLLIFYIHVVAAVTVFTKRWQESDWKEGLLGVVFVALIFSIGWSISAFIVKWFVSEKGFTVWLDRDALSLLLLLVLEAMFFYVQLMRKKHTTSPA